jgi:hypothetical protein
MVFQRTILTPQEAHDAFRWAMQRKWQKHRQECLARGIDPDWIGSHEVDPVCCINCGQEIPWEVIKGWRD